VVTIVNYELLIIGLTGVFNVPAMLALSRELNRIEPEHAYPKRFSDVKALTGIDVSFDDMIGCKNSRQKPAHIIKSAFCGFNDFLCGMARMFQTILADDWHRIKIFRTVESAAQWLDVDVGLLR
jgi:hypothetical protein